MKKILAFLFIVSFLSENSQAQILTKIKNPTGYDAAHEGVQLFGRTVFNDTLYFPISGSGGSAWAKLSGDSIITFSAPANTTIWGTRGLEYKGNLYFPLDSGSSKYLGEFDGTSINLIPSPPGYNSSNGFDGNGIVYKDTLFMRFRGNLDYQLLKFDGTNLVEFQSPPSTRYLGSEIILNDSLYCIIESPGGNNQIAKYTPGGFVIFPNPTGYETGSGMWSGFVVYKGKIYGRIEDNNEINHFFEFDGDSVKVIVTPPAYASNQYRGCMGDPIVHNDTLYWRFQGDDQNHDIFKYDGTTLTEIPSPTGYTGADKGYMGGSMGYSVHDGDLFFAFRTDSNRTDLARFNGNSLTMFVPPVGYGVGGSGVSFEGNLYFNFVNASTWENYLGYFDGTKIDTVDIPACLKPYAEFTYKYWQDVNGKLFVEYRDTTDNLVLVQFETCVIDTTVQQTGNTLSAHNSTDYAYQWLDCGNSHAVIGGETNVDYNMTITGVYAVEITRGSCVDTSFCRNITTLVAVEDDLNSLNIYPNPSSGSFMVDVSSLNVPTVISILSADGKSKEFEQAVSQGLTEINTDLKPGFYIIRISGGDRLITGKVVIE